MPVTEKDSDIITDCTMCDLELIEGTDTINQCPICHDILCSKLMCWQAPEEMCVVCCKSLFEELNRLENKVSRLRKLLKLRPEYQVRKIGI